VPSQSPRRLSAQESRLIEAWGRFGNADELRRICRDIRGDVLEKLALLIADLEGMPAQECRSCGIPFGVGRDEVAFYRSRGLSTPTRCRACRNRRRQERACRPSDPATYGRTI
jgi:Probable zinc-ribbon domain